MSTSVVVILAVGFVLVIVAGVLLAGRSGKPAGTISLPVGRVTNTPGTYEFEVVGESHYQERLAQIAGGKGEDAHRFECEATLVPEDDNPHDSQAIMVQIEGLTVGYLPREMAAAMRQRMAESGYERIALKCPALVIGGWKRDGGDEGHFGVRLDLPEED